MRLAEHPKAGFFGGGQYIVVGLVTALCGLVASVPTTPFLIMGGLCVAFGLTSMVVPWARLGRIGFHVQSGSACVLLGVFDPWLVHTPVLAGFYVMLGVFIGVMLGWRAVLAWSPAALVSLLPLIRAEGAASGGAHAVGFTVLLMAAGLANAWACGLGERAVQLERQQSEEAMRRQLDEQNARAATLTDGVTSLTAGTGRVRDGADRIAGVADDLAASIGTLRQVSEANERTVGQATLRADQVRTAVDELDQWSRSIAQASAAIRAVAGQTGLLALNAAIEAARAGEAGRGFAVVAGEVKDLAQQASGSADEIGTTIEGVQAAIGRVVGIVEAMSGDTEELRRQQGVLSSALADQSESVDALGLVASEEVGGVQSMVEAISRLDALGRQGAGW